MKNAASVILLLILACPMFLTAQSKQVAYNDLIKNNLHGPVKNAHIKRLFVDSSLEDIEVLRYYTLKIYAFEIYTHYLAFNKYGNITETPKSQPFSDSLKTIKVWYDQKDVELKNKGNINYPVYPAYNPSRQMLSLSRDRFNIPTYDTIANIYKYELDQDGHILSEKEYVTGQNVTVPPEERDLYTSTYYQYKDGKLVRQNLVFPKEGGSYERTIHDIPLNNRLKLYRTFDYDKSGRLKRFALYSEGEDTLLLFEEIYTYDSTKNFISTIDRFTYRSKVYNKFPAERMKAIYNENGDLTEAIFFPTGKEARSQEAFVSNRGEIKNRFYTYEYDEYKNWIRCTMYFTSERDKPILKFERIINYYTD